MIASVKVMKSFRIYEQLRKHDCICEFKITINRKLVLERLKKILKRTARRLPEALYTALTQRGV
jgi:hypothetical protein